MSKDHSSVRWAWLHWFQRVSASSSDKRGSRPISTKAAHANHVAVALSRKFDAPPNGSLSRSGKGRRCFFAWSSALIIMAAGIALADRSQCIINCARSNPDLGSGYDACVAACCYELMIFFPPEEASDRSSAPNSKLLKESLVWAEEIERLRISAADPLERVILLRAFIEAPWDDEVLRARFVVPYFLAVATELAFSDKSSIGTEVFSDFILDMARERRTRETSSETGEYAGILALAVYWELGTLSDQEELAVMIEENGLTNLVEDRIDAIAMANPCGSYAAP